MPGCFVNVKITKPIADDAMTRGWVFYDGECPFCIRQVDRFGDLLRKGRIELLPLQCGFARERLHLTDAELLNEMRLLTCDNRLFGGADAIVELTRQIWWAWPLYLLAQIPGIKLLLRKSYAWFAKRRYCFGGKCKIQNRKHTKQSRHKAFFELP